MKSSKVMTDVIRDSIGKKYVGLVLNFPGNYPPERRAFEGVLQEVGQDYLTLETRRSQQIITVQLEYVAYISINEPGKSFNPHDSINI